MTSRSGYEALLVELNKVNASPILLEDYVYFVNKAINLVCNRKYNYYSTNQLYDDDLRVLKSLAELTPENNTVILPNDYFHILNCRCEFTVNGNNKCDKNGDKVIYGAKRLTADSLNLIELNYYNKPKPLRPYYYIHNVNTTNEFPTNPIIEYEDKIHTGTDVGTSEVPKILIFSKDSSLDVVNREAGKRYGNVSNVRMEIRCGNDSRYILSKVIIDYLKVPQYVTLTRNQLDNIIDNSQVWEFPDYMCLEIINELVLLIENDVADPRLQTLMAITLSIASPVQQQTSTTS